MSDLKCHCGAVAMPGEVVCFVHTAQYLSTGAGQRVAESVTRMRDRPLETIEKVKRLMDDNAIAPRTADEIIMSDDDTARMTASKIISGQEERKAGRAAFKAAQLEEALYDEVEQMKAKFTARIAELEAHSAARDRSYDILSKALDSYKAENKRLKAKLSRFSELQYKRLDEANAKIAELEAR